MLSLNLRTLAAYLDLSAPVCCERHQWILVVTCCGCPGRLIGSFWYILLDFWAQKWSGWGPDNPRDSCGPSFKPNRRFSIHFDPNLMFLAPTGTLVSQDFWAWPGFGQAPLLPGSPARHLRLQNLSCLNSRHLSCLNSRHLSCLSSSHLSCRNSRHLSCLNRRHLSCLNRRRASCGPPAGCCYVFC